MTYPRIRRMLFCALVSCTTLTTAGQAQTNGQLAPLPVRTAADENGVDVVSGKIAPNPRRYLTIGPDDHRGLSLDRVGGSSGFSTLLSGIEVVGNKTYVSIGVDSDSFIKSGANYVSTEGKGATLTYAGGIYTYTAKDGTKATFATNEGFAYSFYEGDLARLGTIIFPDGVKWTPTMRLVLHCPGGYENRVCMSPKYYVGRIESLRSSTGYQLKPIYASNTATPDDVSYENWGRITDIIALNNNIETCDTQTCNPVNSWPRQSTASVPSLRISYTYANNKIYTATNHGVTYTYSYAENGNERTTTVTDPNGGQKVYVGDIAANRVTSVRDELSRTTHYVHDSKGRLTQVTYPAGNMVQYAYDDRGNVITQTSKAKPGSGLADIVVSAGYDATCANAKTCNQPNWTKDAKGNQTDYTYDPNHGGILTVTAPADVQGRRPQTRYSYTQTDGMYFRTGISECRTTTSCIGTADETKTAVQYGGLAQNYLPISVSKGAGDGSLTATSTLTHDVRGRLTSVDGPLAGSADTTNYRYDNDGKVIGIVGVDPDGAGTRVPTAQRITYDADHNVTKSEIGTVADASDAAWTAFAPAQAVETTYDSNARAIKQEVKASGTTHSVTQASYDNLGRIECTAERMDSTQWTAQTNVCTPQTSGANGSDRVTKQVYDAASQVTQVQNAVGTADAANEVTASYTVNGKVETVTDGLNNKTSYEYDGHDRFIKTRYPTTTAGTLSSSTTDYEEQAYDANSNVTLQRMRDGQLIGYTYDNLGRVISKDVPAGQQWDTAYEYDLQGQLTKATGDGWAINAFTYDALGRLTVEQNYNATTTHAYDVAGRQTRLTWNDNFYVDYDYDAAGNMTAIRENGATSGVGVLATYAYDILGRRTSVMYGNGTSESYGYDPLSRLASLGTTLPANPTSNLSQTFTYNPASQIASVTRSNDAYAWNGHYNRNDSATVNGLNQMTAQGALNLTHDLRGNVTGVGSKIYTYNAENRLKTASGGITLQQEVTGNRLLQLYNGTSGVDMRFGWSGDTLISEINAANWQIARRYVPGADEDTPVVWYEGSGTGDRRFLHADERGSIISVTNSAGGLIGINRYDEYGAPAATNIGRFQYTGQSWFPELGLYNYKARFYDPKLGRFLQTDPIGYGDGMNMYNYAASDPVNKVDPSGLCYVYQIHLYKGWSNGYNQYLGTNFMGTFDCDRAFGGRGPNYNTDQTTNYNGANAAVKDAYKPARKPKRGECFSRDSKGRCSQRFREDGKLELDKEYAKRACDAYHSMMRSTKEVGAAAGGTNLPGVANVVTGGSFGPLSKISNFFSKPGFVFIRGVTYITTLTLSMGPPPPGCK